MICSESKLDCEVSFITETLCNYGFPEDIVRSIIRDKIAHFHKTKLVSAQKRPVYLRLPWLGDIGDRFPNQISARVRKCCFFSNLRVVFRTRTVLPSRQKDVLPTTTITNIAVLKYILLDVFPVCNTSGEQIDDWTRELNNMRLRKYG